MTAPITTAAVPTLADLRREIVDAAAEDQPVVGRDPFGRTERYSTRFNAAISDYGAAQHRAGVVAGRDAALRELLETRSPSGLTGRAFLEDLIEKTLTAWDECDGTRGDFASRVRERLAQAATTFSLEIANARSEGVALGATAVESRHALPDAGEIDEEAAGDVVPEGRS